MKKQIRNFPNYYVDEKGNVFRKKDNRYVRLKKQVNRDGYNKVFIWNEEGCKQFYVARLVAEAFFSAFDKENLDILVQHNNSIRNDDRLENLCLSNKKDIANKPSARENRRIALESSTEFQKTKNLSNQEKKKIVVVEGIIYESISEAARYEKVSRVTVRNRVKSEYFPLWMTINEYVKKEKLKNA